MSSRRSTSAPPRVASRSASRAVRRLASVPPARDEQRVLHVDEHVAPFVRRAAVDSEPDPHMCIEHGPHGRYARAEPQVGGGAVRDADSRPAERRHVGVRQVDAVRTPHVVGDPPDALEVLDRRAVEELAAVRILLDRLGEMRVQLQAEPARERGRLLHQPRRHRERASRVRLRSAPALRRRGGAAARCRRESCRCPRRVSRAAGRRRTRRGPSSLATRRCARRAPARRGSPPRRDRRPRAGRRSDGRRRWSSLSGRARRGRISPLRTPARRRCVPRPGTASSAT